MHRLARIAVCLFAACHAPERPAIRAHRFPVEYCGRITDFAGAEPAARSATVPMPCTAPDAVHLRVRIVEIPVDAPATATWPLLAPYEPAFAPSLRGCLVATADLDAFHHAATHGVTAYEIVIDAPLAATSVVQHPEPHHHLVDFEVEITAGTATAVPIHEAVPCGMRIELTPTLASGGERLAFAWHVDEPLYAADEPIAAGSRYRLPAPRLVQHRFAGRSRLPVGHSLLVGSLPAAPRTDPSRLFLGKLDTEQRRPRRVLRIDRLSATPPTSTPPREP